MNITVKRLYVRLQSAFTFVHYTRLVRSSDKHLLSTLHGKRSGDGINIPVLHHKKICFVKKSLGEYINSCCTHIDR